MEKPIYFRYDKLRNKEYITWNDEEIVNDFGYSLLDFLYADVKTRYYEIIDGATKDNHKEIYKKVYELLDDNLLCKLFYSPVYKRCIEYGNLAEYTTTFKDVHNVEFKDEKPFNSKRDGRVRNVLDTIEHTQKSLSLILEFCSINTASAHDNHYNQYINKFNYACKKLLGNTTVAQPTFDTTDRVPRNKMLSLDTLKNDYQDYLESKKEFKMETNPVDDYFYTAYNLETYFVTVMFQLFNRHYIISKCKNCGKLFVPFKNNLAIYCDRQSPQNPSKTCKEFEGSKPKGLNTLYRKIYQKKFARVSRNKNDYTLKKEFETWKEKAQKIKAKYDNGKITADEYKKWLLDNDK